MTTARTIIEPCPSCSREMTFPETATEVVCPGCNSRFSLVDEPTAHEQTEALGGASAAPPPPAAPATPEAAAAPATPPAPVVPAASPTPIQPTAPPPGATPVQQPADPGAPLADPEDDEDGPLGAGDVTTPAEQKRRGGGRKPIALAPKRPGVTDFIHRTREYQWVAKGGLGNPYGPTSVSTAIFDLVAESGPDGIDPVDLAVGLRSRIIQAGRECRSVLQRIVMVCERVCCNEHVGLMERVGDTERIRVVEKHRIPIPIPPDDMVGVKRRRDLEAARKTAAELASLPTGLLALDAAVAGGLRPAAIPTACGSPSPVTEPPAPPPPPS